MTLARAGIAAVASAVLVTAVIAGDRLDARAGKALFERTWVPAPASTDASDGLGPLFNARSCVNCHAAGGGARIVTAPDGTRRLQGVVVRLGTKDGLPDPFYGAQLQTDAVPGLQAEAVIQYLPGLKIDLKGPPLSAGIAAGVRIAPTLIGSAAFDRVADSEILKRADPDDADGDGISGRARIVGGAVGRYGWKAAHAKLDDQIAYAFLLDMGLSSPRQPLPYGDCTTAETVCRHAPSGENQLSDGREVSDAVINLVAEYVQTLERPAQPLLGEGAAQFAAARCARCHVPELKAIDGTPVTAYTDLLLHDMGRDLDDHVGEPGVASTEWRTAPLKNNSPRAATRRYLHDGSAASIEAAIAKHRGEAATSRQAFFALSEADRGRLIGFVNGLE